MEQRVIRSRSEWMSGYRRVLEARDPATPDDRLLELATDYVRPVRLYVARNPRAPQQALQLLAVDADSTVQWNVLLNPGAPAQALRAMAQQEAARYGGRSWIVRHRVARHPNAPTDLG